MTDLERELYKLFEKAEIAHNGNCLECPFRIVRGYDEEEESTCMLAFVNTISEVYNEIEREENLVC